MAEIQELGKTVLAGALGASLASDFGYFDGVTLPPASAGMSLEGPSDFVGMVNQVQDLVANGVVEASVGLAFQIAQLGLIVAYASWLFKKAFGLDK